MAVKSQGDMGVSHYMSLRCPRLAYIRAASPLRLSLGRVAGSFQDCRISAGHGACNLVGHFVPIESSRLGMYIIVHCCIDAALA